MEALELKEQGNALFKSGQYEEAVDIYTQAISSCQGSNVRCFSIFLMCSFFSF